MISLSIIFEKSLYISPNSTVNRNSLPKSQVIQAARESIYDEYGDKDNRRTIKNKLHSRLGRSIRFIGKLTGSNKLRNKGKSMVLDAVKKNQSRLSKNLYSHGIISKRLNAVKGYAEAKKVK